jgi:hypothetical protein
MHFKNDFGGYVNSDRVFVWQLEEPTSNVWVIRGYLETGTGVTLAGTWSTQAEASEALRELVGGVDPSTYGD